MPMGITYANAALNHFVRGVTQSAPASRYVALYTLAPLPDGSGGVEVAAADYARQALTTATAAALAKVTNTSIVTFVNSAAAAWGTIVAFAVFDAATGGNVIFHGLVAPNLVVGIGSPVNVPIGQLVVELPFS